MKNYSAYEYFTASLCQLGDNSKGMEGTLYDGGAAFPNRCPRRRRANLRLIKFSLFSVHCNHVDKVRCRVAGILRTIRTNDNICK